ncbi:hypothetical protein HA402_010830 [Bradysia odoriphaga]|nr:hypothetical protein HA402_010830 [Bradysia odoriphaga]
MIVVLIRIYYSLVALVFTIITGFTWPLILLLQTSTFTRELYYSYILGVICKLVTKSVGPIKMKMFDDMHKYCEELAPPESDKVIKVLEIGPGVGDNFKFYKSPVQLTTIDHNVFLKETADKLAIDYPLVNVVDSKLGNAENMTCFEDNTFDIVLGTLIMCCVNDNNAVLSEIHRVLKPNGRYYYFEGNRMQPTRSQIMRSLEYVLSYVWRCCEFGCKFLHNNFDQKLKSSKLVTQWNVIYAPPECPLNHEIHYGCAMKI